MWRGGRCLQGRDWQECIFSRWGAPWQPGSQRWGEVQLWLHSVHHHQSSMRVTGTYKDPLDRQIMERIQIQNFKGPVLMNRRSEMGGVRVDRMKYRRWGGDWAGWLQQPNQPKTLQVTRETLSSRAGATVIYSNSSQEVALGNLFNISFVTREEVPMLDSDLERKLERRLKTRQVEPMGDGGVVEGGAQINQHQDCDLKQISI